MAKKYVPSGYQIINIGNFADSDSFSDYPNNADLKVLHETLKRIGTTGIIEKPFLITGHDLASNSDFQAIPSCYVKRSSSEITNVILEFSTSNLHLNIDYDVINDDGVISIL